MDSDRPPWLHRRIPYDPRPVRLPGMAPCDMADWLLVDEAFAGQMALRDTLVARQAEAVIAALPGSEAACAELLALVLARLAKNADYRIGADTVVRPDGGVVALDAPPITVLARLCQDDFCILERQGDQHVLRAAALCFPAHWTLREKIGRPLTDIHTPVAGYAGDLARRVQRLFDAARPMRPLWRNNALKYADPTLFQPAREGSPRARTPGAARYLRSERQGLLRLPDTGAMVFSIHTYLLHRDDVPPVWWDGVPD